MFFNIEILIIAVCVMMFVQSLIQIGSPIKQKIGYIWTQIFVVILYKKYSILFLTVRIL